VMARGASCRFNARRKKIRVAAQIAVPGHVRADGPLCAFTARYKYIHVAVHLDLGLISDIGLIGAPGPAETEDARLSMYQSDRNLPERLVLERPHGKAVVP